MQDSRANGGKRFGRAFDNGARWMGDCLANKNLLLQVQLLFLPSFFLPKNTTICKIYT